MRTSFRLLSVAGLSTLMFAGSALAQGSGTTAPPSRDRGAQPQRDNAPPRDRAGDTKPSAAKVGEKAPNFTLTDTTGKSHSLTDYKGKTVVLQWINPECPYCVRVMKDGQVKDAMKEAKALDSNVVWLLVNSTSHMPSEGSAKYLKEHELKVPALVDQPGTVGRLYGARTSPHLFVIDAEGVLRYEGAIDDDPQGTKADSDQTVTNYVVNAIRQMKSGDTVSPANTRPYGCNVKYPKEPAAPSTPSTPRTPATR